MSTTQLVAALSSVRDALVHARLPLELPGVVDQRKLIKQVTVQLDDYVLPRLATIDAPMLAVVGGSTGAGKSTLVNSLVGRRVTIPGVIRPTTRSPVLVYNPSDEKWFSDQRILPGMARARGASLDVKALQLVAEPTLPSGLALLDAPDIDSVVSQNRELATQLLAAADLWLFVTSAARYADAVPWDYLRSAVDRSAAVAVVCDRIPPQAMREVPQHLAEMMTERGLENSPLFAVPETSTDSNGLLPNASVAPIRRWLASLAADQVTRQTVVLQTLAGAIDHVIAKTPAISAGLQSQVEAVTQLRSDAHKSFDEAIRAINIQTADGTLLRGEVLSRWHDFVGTGDFFRALDQKVGWIRDRIKRVFTGPAKEPEGVKIAVESGLEALIKEEGQAACERAEAAWQATPAGRDLLLQISDDLRHTSADFTRRAARTIRDWQGDVLELVADDGVKKRSQARYVALGVNALGVALMLVVFINTAGLTGAEVGIAGGTAALAQRVLEAVFGDEAVRRLAKKAKDDLDSRVKALIDEERQRFDAALATLKVEPGRIELIDHAVHDLAAANQLPLPGASTRPELTAGPAQQVTSGPIAELTADVNSAVVEAEIVAETSKTEAELPAEEN